MIHISDYERIYAAPCENVSSDICGQRRSRSACASAQSDQSLTCPLTESLDATEYFNGEQTTECYFARTQDDLNLRILRRPFSLDMVFLYPFWRFYWMTKMKRKGNRCFFRRDNSIKCFAALLKVGYVLWMCLFWTSSILFYPIVYWIDPPTLYMRFTYS